MKTMLILLAAPLVLASPSQDLTRPDLQDISFTQIAEPAVRWHEDYDAALLAAEKSRKPVLLFQLLGRLDEELC